MAKEHKVKAGECLASIAVHYGHLPRTLEDHPANSALREKRRDLYALLAEEDEIFVPDIATKSEKIPVNQRTRFLRKGVPEVLRLRFADADNKPRKGLLYLFEVDGESRSGKLDEDGWLQEWVPLHVDVAELTLVDPDLGEEYYELGLSHLAPVEELEGIQDRLRNLGYDFTDRDGVLAEEAYEALARFRKDLSLAEDGAPTARTCDEVEAEYGP